MQAQNKKSSITTMTKKVIDDYYQLGIWNIIY